MRRPVPGVHSRWPCKPAVLTRRVTGRCCKEEGLQRSVAVEVKAIHTEGGRTKFLDLLR